MQNVFARLPHKCLRSVFTDSVPYACNATTLMIIIIKCVFRCNKTTPFYGVPYAS